MFICSRVLDLKWVYVWYMIYLFVWDLSVDGRWIFIQWIVDAILFLLFSICIWKKEKYCVAQRAHPHGFKISWVKRASADKWFADVKLTEYMRLTVGQLKCASDFAKQATVAGESFYMPSTPSLQKDNLWLWGLVFRLGPFRNFMACGWLSVSLKSAVPWSQCVCLM